MPVTLQDVITRLRSALEEPSARFWQDYELTNWVNDATRDMGRRCEDLLTFDTSITLIPNVANYPLPSDMIRIHRMEYIPSGNTLTYPIQPSTFQEMDQIWGINQASPSSYPSYFVIWGYPGGTGRNQFTIQLYPVPSNTGRCNLFYYRLPYRFDVVDIQANPGTSPEYKKIVESVEGWDDCIVMYAVAMAKMKDRDASWQDTMNLYEAKIIDLMDRSRQWHDQQRMIMTSSGTMQPNWLYRWSDD